MGARSCGVPEDHVIAQCKADGKDAWLNRSQPEIGASIPLTAPHRLLGFLLAYVRFYASTELQAVANRKQEDFKLSRREAVRSQILLELVNELLLRRRERAADTQKDVCWHRTSLSPVLYEVALA